ncbi:hypothetical protein bcgnr5380_32750 [Bacillus cereus]
MFISPNSTLMGLLEVIGLNLYPFQSLLFIGIIALLYIFKNLPNVVSRLLSSHKIFFVSVGMDRF